MIDRAVDDRPAKKKTSQRNSFLFLTDNKQINLSILRLFSRVMIIHWIRPFIPSQISLSKSTPRLKKTMDKFEKCSLEKVREKIHLWIRPPDLPFMSILCLFGPTSWAAFWLFYINNSTKFANNSSRCFPPRSYE